MAPSKQAKRNHRRRIVRFWFLFTVLLGVLAGLLEAGVRLAFPNINHQGTELALFRDRAFGESSGWQPNATGNAFGAPVTTDEFGFRKLPSPVDYRESWLVLGDSVAFGVGVDAVDTFLGRLQLHLADVKLWNTAVVGYSAQDYLAVQDHFNDPQNKMKRVILCLCLNDIYPLPNLKPAPSGIVFRSLAWLGRNSKCYLLLKNLFFDRSRQYFERDLARYDEHSPDLAALFATLKTIRQKAASAGLSLTVLILPYEYQLREKSEAALRPQKALTDFFAKNQIPYLDAYPWLAQSGIDSKKLFLYADAMHLSAAGHEQVYSHLVKQLDEPAAR